MEPVKRESAAAVEALLREGKSRADIFKELGGTDDLARIIAFVPSLESRQQHRGKNLALVGVLIYLALMKLATGISIVASTGASPYLVLLALPYAAIAAYLAFHIHRFQGWAYLMSTGVCLYVLTMSAKHIFTKTAGALLTVNILLQLPLVLGVVLGIMLKNALCPDVGFLGAKTDKDGKYLFMSKAG